MSVAEAAQRPAGTGRAVALWLAFLIIIAAGIGLAWYGAGSLRPEVTASGLQFRTIKAGTGEPISPRDAAQIDYILTVGGKPFDASEVHGGPQVFTMEGMFPGFAEAMARMQEGGVYQFTFPPRLAFPNGHAPPSFPAGDLTFQVRVLKVVRGGATMSFQGPPPNPPQQ